MPRSKIFHLLFSLLVMRSISSSSAECSLFRSPNQQRWRHPCRPSPVSPSSTIIRNRRRAFPISWVSKFYFSYISTSSAEMRDTLLAVQRSVVRLHLGNTVHWKNDTLPGMPKVEKESQQFSAVLLEKWEGSLANIAVYMEHTRHHIRYHTASLPLQEIRGLERAVDKLYIIMCRVQDLHHRLFGPHAWSSASLSTNDVIPAEWRSFNIQVKSNICDFLVVRDSVAFFDYTRALFRRFLDEGVHLAISASTTAPTTTSTPRSDSSSTSSRAEPPSSASTSTEVVFERAETERVHPRQGPPGVVLLRMSSGAIDFGCSGWIVMMTGVLVPIIASLIVQ